MSQATMTDTHSMTLISGLVREGAAGRFVVETQAGPVAAVQAVSCLVEPQTGDEVLLAESGGDGFVLAVLRQTDPSRTSLSLRGDVSLRVPNGSLSLEADRMHIAAGAMDWVAGRLTQRVQKCFRWVEGIEQVTVGRLRYFIGEVFDVMGGQVQIKADRKVKIDGETIHFG